MADRELSYKITTDSSKAVAGLKTFGSAVKKEMKSSRDELDDTSTASEKVAKALKKMADDSAEEMRKTAKASEALGTALGDLSDDVDVEQLVGQLRKAGLTLDDITTDADQLADAIRHVDEVNKSLGGGTEGPADLAADYDTAKTSVGEYSDEVSRADGTTHSFVGNALSEIPGIQETFGPLGEAVGQFTEQLAAGEIGLRDIAAAAGPMAAVTLGVLAVTRVIGEFQNRSAFATELTDAWTEALAEAGDAAANMTAAQRELNDAPDTRGFSRFGTNLLPFSKATNDLADDLQRAGLTVEQFNRLVVGGPSAITAWGNAMQAAGVKVPTSVITAAAEQYKAYTAAQDAAAVSADVFKLSQEQVNAEVERFVQQKDPVAAFPEEFQRIATALTEGTSPAVTDMDTVTQGLNITLGDAITIADDLATSEKDLADDTRKLADAHRAAESAAASHKRKWDELNEALSDRQATKDLQQAFEDTKVKIDDALDSWKKKSDEAKGKTSEAEDALWSLEQQVISYGQDVLGLPPQVVTDLVLKLEQGKLDEVNAWLREFEKGVKVPVEFYPVGGSRIRQNFATGTPGAPGGEANLAEHGAELIVHPTRRHLKPGTRVFSASDTRKILASSSSAQPGYVDNRSIVVNVAAKLTGRELEQVLNRWAKVNGGRVV